MLANSLHLHRLTGGRVGQDLPFAELYSVATRGTPGSYQSCQSRSFFTIDWVTVGNIVEYADTLFYGNPRTCNSTRLQWAASAIA